jgi:hypothetical protein
LIRRHALAVGLQALGSAATVLVVMLVARRFGLEAQGRFGLLKSWMDLAVAAGLLGLPQALLHMAYHGGAAPGRLRAYAERYAGFVLLVALAAAAVAALGPAPWLAWALLAVPGLVLHGLLRSLLLKPAGPVAYALATAAPAVLLLGVVAVLALIGRPAFGAALVLASVLAAVLAWWMLARAGLHREPLAGLRLPADIHRHAFLQNLCAAAQVALLLGLLSGLGASEAALGEASVSLLVLQLFGVAAAYLAPLVYDQAARAAVGAPAADRPTAMGGESLPAASPDEPALAAAKAAPAWRWLAALAVVALAAWALPSLLALALPQAGPSLRWACQVMAAAGVVLLVNRLWATQLQARGAFGWLSALALLRLVASVGVLALLWQAPWTAGTLDAAGALAAAVLVAELLVLLPTALALRRPGRAQ